MPTVVYEFEIPDPTKALLEDALIEPSRDLVPFTPLPLDPDTIVGRQIDDVITYLGTYGMGGPGFFGLRLGGEWLVVSVWGAGDWMKFADLRVEDHFWEDDGRPAPWGLSDLKDAVAGQRIKEVNVERTSLRITLDGGESFEIDEDPSSRPVFAGNGEARVFSDEDDLRKAVFLSPTAEIWV